SRFIGQLADAGLIRRTADPDDRRAALVEATAQGRRLRERIHRERRRALETYVDELDDEQRETLWRALPVLEELAERLPARRPWHACSARRARPAGTTPRGRRSAGS